MSTPCWLYKGQCFTPDDVDPRWKGFVYKITCIGGDYPGWFYIGSKMFTHLRTRKLSKKRADELYTLKGRRGGKQRKEKVTIPSKWLEYQSSSTFLKELIERYGRDTFQFEIIDFGTSKSDVLFREVEHIIRLDCLRSERCFNEWISIKLHKKTLK